MKKFAYLLALLVGASTQAALVIVPPAVVAYPSNKIAFRDYIEVRPYGPPWVIVFEGDSLTASRSVVARGGRDWPSILLSQAGYKEKGQVVNFAENGAHLGTMLTEYTNRLHAIKPPVANAGILFLSGGVGDAYSGTNYATLTNALATYWGLARGDGYKVTAFTMTHFDGYGAGPEGVRTNVNIWIRSASNLWDWLVDQDLYITNNATQTSDGIHWTAAENTNLAVRVNAAIALPWSVTGDEGRKIVQGAAARFDGSLYAHDAVITRSLHLDYPSALSSGWIDFYEQGRTWRIVSGDGTPGGRGLLQIQEFNGDAFVGTRLFISPGGLVTIGTLSAGGAISTLGNLTVGGNGKFTGLVRIDSTAPYYSSPLDFYQNGDIRWRIMSGTGSDSQSGQLNFQRWAGGGLLSTPLGLTSNGNFVATGAAWIVGAITNDALTASKVVGTDATKKLVSLDGIAGTVDVLVKGGTTNRLVFSYGLLVSNIVSF